MVIIKTSATGLIYDSIYEKLDKEPVDGVFNMQVFSAKDTMAYFIPDEVDGMGKAEFSEACKNSDVFACFVVGQSFHSYGKLYTTINDIFGFNLPVEPFKMKVRSGETVLAYPIKLTYPPAK